MEDIRIELTKHPKEKPNVKGIPFGTYFTDHMFLMSYSREKGWHDKRIVPYAPLCLDPSAMVFHYAQEIFEGMKAYRTADGTVQLSRPMENVRRMNRSADRMCIPQMDEDEVLDAIVKFVEVEADWVPSAPGTSLYIRPFIIATDPHLGVHASHTYLFIIIACPVDAYYAEGINPVKIMIESQDVRAVRGGTGYTKCGGNYAASIRAGERAEEQGFSQVLWLDGVERKYIEEVGSMNVMFKIKGKIVTPELTGSVLPGITRKSCLEILEDWGYTVEERLLSVDELMEAASNGDLEEAWGTGTAAVVSPIGEIAYGGKDYGVCGGQIGPVTQKLYDTLVGIQWGQLEDKYGWTLKVK